MKRIFFCLVLLFLTLSLSYCSQEKEGKGKLLARINDYNLTLEEFQKQLTVEAELDRDFKLTKGTKKEFLEGIIRKEILIQEAKRLKLDGKEKFVRAIERYWESTLIRDLMELKGEEISQNILTSKEEIGAYHNEMKKSGDTLPPLSEARDKLIEELKEKKKISMLKEWINDLRNKAKIEIAEELL